MSFNILGAITGGIAGAVSGLFGGTSATQSAAMQTFDPMQLEEALAQQPDALQNVNKLSSFANSMSSGNDLLANLIDGDGGDA